MSCLLSIRCNLTSSYLHFADLADMSTNLLHFSLFYFLQLKKPLSTVSIPGSHTALSVNTCTANMSKKTGDGEKSIKSDDKG